MGGLLWSIICDIVRALAVWIRDAFRRLTDPPVARDCGGLVRRQSAYRARCPSLRRFAAFALAQVSLTRQQSRPRMIKSSFLRL
jgi:hypothetical protein